MNEESFMTSVMEARLNNRHNLRVSLLSASKAGVLNSAVDAGVDPKKYKNYYDLVNAIVNAKYPNLSDDPNN